MLVLSRKYQEKIRIGNGITITVLRAKGKTVRLGIEAPADVPVIRGELAFDAPSQDGEQNRVACDAWQTGDPTAKVIAKRRQLSQRDTATMPAGQVSLRRVSRGRAAQILPQLPPGQGPIRAMLNQRAGNS